MSREHALCCGVLTCLVGIVLVVSGYAALGAATVVRAVR